MSKVQLDSGLTFAQLAAVVYDGATVELSQAAALRINHSRAIVDDITADGSAIYGINTGFGKFATTRIGGGELRELQRNLILSHAVGVGEPLAEEYVRAMLLLRAQSLTYGASGVRLRVLKQIVDFLNHHIHPVIPTKGSVGASGDLAPLAHMVLGMLGEGDVFYQGERRSAAEVLREVGLEPLVLEAKEGLALINGTQYMSAHLALGLIRTKRLLLAADIAAALSVEGAFASHTPFRKEVTDLRPHPGAKTVARNMRVLLANSDIAVAHANCNKVQDPYSFRGVPQVHGASRDAVTHVEAQLQTEFRSVTDNPLVLTETGEVVSAGNFHGQPLALIADYAAIAVAEMGNISERRVEQLVNPALSGLPAFLTPHGGLHSGLMIAQYTAAALVSENKVLAHPASVDSIPTSANQEDHVSMGAFAARKFTEIVDNVASVIGIELIAGAQALDFRAPLKPATNVRHVHAFIRQHVPTLAEDRLMQDDLQVMKHLVISGELLDALPTDVLEQLSKEDGNDP